MREEMRAMAGMSALNAGELELEIAARVREAFWDLHAMRESLVRTEKSLLILNDLDQIAQTRYAVGSGIQQDVLRAQSESHKLKARLAGLRQEERANLAALNVLLGRNAAEPLEIVLDAPMVPPLPANPEELAEEALARRPVLQALALEIQRQETRTALANKASWPDLELEAGVMSVSPIELPSAALAAASVEEAMTQMPADTAFSVGLMVSVPLWKGSKQDRKVAETRAGREEAAARLEAARLSVGLEVQTLSEASRALREQIRAFEDEVLPRDRQAVGSALESYQAGSADFLTLLSSQLTALDDELELHRHQAA
jgi:outer membrane protein TolC